MPTLDKVHGKLETKTYGDIFTHFTESIHRLQYFTNSNDHNY